MINECCRLFYPHGKTGYEYKGRVLNHNPFKRKKIQELKFGVTPSAEATRKRGNPVRANPFSGAIVSITKL